jgi:multiple sugar transport system ATP-binding protein
MAAITLAELTKAYDHSRVVDDVSLEIRDGEFFVFVGPSGSGKSTILRLIAGLINPSGGDIRFDGESMAALPPRDRNVAMVFQNYALYPHKSVYDNIAFGLRARKVPEEEVRQRVEKAAAMLGVESFLNRWPKELSGGERQRVAIGRAIVRQPRTYLLDEPLSNLDARLRIEMRNEIASMHRRLATTFVYVTHDQIEAMTLGDRIAVINHGKIEQIDNPADLYDFPANRFVAGFIGSPPMNFVEGTFHRDAETDSVRIALPEGSMDLEGKMAESLPLRNGDPIVIGIRPESVNLDTPDSSSAEGVVSRIEPVGREGLIHLNVLGWDMIARVPNWRQYRDVKKLVMGIHIDETHLFLPDSGQCVWSGGKRLKNS